MELSNEAEELLVYANNEESLNRHKDAILKNYAKKMTKGVFDRDLAIKGLLPWVTTAARMYGDEFMSKDEWKTVFSVEDRRDVAAEMVDEFVEEHEFQKDQNPVEDVPVDEEMGVMESTDDEDDEDEAPKSHYVWAWGNSGKKILFRGTEEDCDEFKSEYRGYPQDDIYVSKSSMDESIEDDTDEEDDEDETPYDYMMKNKGRIAKVENRPAKTPKPTLGEDAEAEPTNIKMGGSTYNHEEIDGMPDLIDVKKAVKEAITRLISNVKTTSPDKNTHKFIEEYPGVKHLGMNISVTVENKTGTIHITLAVSPKDEKIMDTKSKNYLLSLFSIAMNEVMYNNKDNKSNYMKPVIAEYEKIMVDNGWVQYKSVPNQNSFSLFMYNEVSKKNPEAGVHNLSTGSHPVTEDAEMARNTDEEDADVDGEKYIEITYEIITPESAEQGDAEERGWADERGNRYSEHDDSLKISMTPDEYDTEEGLTAVDLAVKALKNAGARHPNDSRLPTSYGTPEDTDYASGNVETKEYHLNGFSDEELMEIKQGLMVR